MEHGAVTTQHGEPFGTRSTKPAGTLAEVAAVFLRLGFLAFGGPAAHIAMMQDEVVERRQWVNHQRFLDLLGITNLIPGPNSTEMAIHLGYLRAGWPGLVVAGLSFIAPASLIVLALAWLYVRYGTAPEAAWLLYGVKPVIIAIVAQAVIRLGKTAMKRTLAWVLAAIVATLYLLGGNEIALLFGGAISFALLARMGRRGGASREGVGTREPAQPTPGLLFLPSTPVAHALAAGPTVAATAPAVPFSLNALFWTCLKIGSVLYGSGYVLIAFLRNDFVHRFGWLTDQQLLDAVAIGQFTPGPVFTTATFIGYVTGRWWGALLATLGIFLPSFVFVALVHPLADLLRRSPWTSSLLDGVNVAAVALMGGVLLQMSRSALVDALTWGMALTSLVLLLWIRLNSAWLILVGALIGLLQRSLGG